MPNNKIDKLIESIKKGHLVGVTPGEARELGKRGYDVFFCRKKKKSLAGLIRS